jgi:peptide/nickel transport system permease protein
MTQEKVKAAGKSDGRGEAVISPGKQALRRFLKNKLALIGTAVLVFLILFVLLGPATWNVDPNETNTTSTYQMPMTGNYPLGTDELGRDVLARIMSGGRVSLSIGLASAVVAICLGTLIGALAGYYGKIIDSILMRFTDLAMTIPSLPLLIVLGGMIGPSPGLLVVLISILNWMGTARLVRSRFLTLRTLDYIKAAQAVGCKNGRIIFKHLLPNTLGPIIVTATLTVGRAIIMESTLSFLGVGINPPTATWGNMLQSAQTAMTRTPWLAILPGMMILLTVLSINFLGDGLNDALDPRQSR